MRQELARMLDAMHRYNRGSPAKDYFGLDPEDRYDLLVVAPSWKPARIFSENRVLISTLAEHSVTSGYRIDRMNRRIAWINCSTGAPNLIDSLCACAELDFGRMLFVGAAGSLSADFRVGDFCTPTRCVSGVGAAAYLCERLADFRPFGEVEPNDPRFVERVTALAKEAGHTLRPASVFSTDSSALEYCHLEEIRSFGTDLIEMETASFYLMAGLMEKPAAALLAVSDSTAEGIPLTGRTEEERILYDRTRFRAVPDTIFKVAEIRD